MMPDRFMTPRRAAYVMIFLSIAVVSLAAWNVRLSQRVAAGEALRRSDAANAVARRQQGCLFANTIVDVAINIPIKNLEDILNGGTLTEKERVDRMEALARYKAKLRTLQPTIEACAR